MSELTTADLAGGTTPRDRKDTDPRMATTTRDPMVDARDPKMVPSEVRRDDPGFDTRRDTASETRHETMATPPATSTAHRTSQLANPAATDGATTDHGAAPLFPTGEVESFR